MIYACPLKIRMILALSIYHYGGRHSAYYMWLTIKTYTILVYSLCRLQLEPHTIWSWSWLRHCATNIIPPLVMGNTALSNPGKNMRSVTPYSCTYDATVNIRNNIKNMTTLLCCGQIKYGPRKKKLKFEGTIYGT